MKQRFYILAILIGSIVALASCGSDNNEPPAPESPTYTLSITCALPEGLTNGTLSDVTLSLKESNTGQTSTPKATTNALKVTAQVARQGLYSIELSGKLHYTDAKGNVQESQVKAYTENVTVNTAATDVAMTLYYTNDDGHTGFVLAEVFCAGSATPQGNYYYADKYFVIYNNTDHVLYADSLAIAESQFLTTQKQDYTPDLMSTDFSIKALYMIPGSGKDHPVQPGESLLICDNALNHTLANPNSWDLSKADFEWYDESTNPSITDVDNPDVPTLDRIYTSSLTLWSPHTQGFTAFALVRMGTSKEDFLANYSYDYSYTLVTAAGEFPMEGSCYRVPNSWIIDAVNLSSRDGYQWLVTSPQLDRGFTYCSEFNFDDTRFGKAVRRKVASHTSTGRATLIDTNNSTNDFEPRVKADPFHKF